MTFLSLRLRHTCIISHCHQCDIRISVSLPKLRHADAPSLIVIGIPFIDVLIIFTSRNGEFEMMVNSPNNSFIEDGVLYLVPTLTSNVIGTNVPDGFVYNVTGCTSTNGSACGAVQNSTLKQIINPVQSARLTTVNTTSIRYGRVEIRARIPTGDWIWPALWMLPVNNVYGPWPLSGEIDIMEARGNPRSYPAQGVDFVRGSLNWGPLATLNENFRTFGWWQARRSTFNQGFHTYVLEWSDKFM